jgi:hypothetical protein
MQLLTPEKLAQGAADWCFCWWQLTPGLVAAWLSILGLEVVESYTHSQLYGRTGHAIPHFTVVACHR